jgi:hypothetical protein
MSIKNPNPKKLIVLKVIYRDNLGSTSFLFPLNPAEFEVTQSNRVGTVFTYGEKVFQNLGRGLKTITISGHTGFRIDYNNYGIFSSSENALDSQISPASGSKKESGLVTDLATDGANLFLDLYSVIQLIKGENVFLSGDPEANIDRSYSIDNIDKIKDIQLIIPDESIVYNVLLQSDSFMRSKDQPHLYKYQISFVVTNESINIISSISTESPVRDPSSSVDVMINATQKISGAIDSVKKNVLGLPGVSNALAAYSSLNNSIDKAVKSFIAGDSVINRTLNDLRRLESLNNTIKSISTAISTMRSTVQILQSYGDLSAFYETKIYAKQAIKQAELLLDHTEAKKRELAFKVNLTRLASVSTPVTIAANNSTIAMVQTDIKKLIMSGFVIPIQEIKEIDTSTGKKIAVYFSNSLSSLNISDVKIFKINDYSRSNNLVGTLNDTQMILSGSFFELGGSIFNFQIEYAYKTFEQINQSLYQSIRRVKVLNGDTYRNILKKYASTEVSTIPTYESEVAYLNEIEYPYIVTRASDKYSIYQGSFANKLFSTNAEFLSYVSNITITGVEGQLLPLYEYNTVKSSFLIDDPDLVTLLLVANTKFFVLLFKETYSNRLYALFGIVINHASDSEYLFRADYYYLFAIEKGKSYEIKENVIWEILSPYTINDDLIDFYGQRAFLDSVVSDDLFTRDKLVIQNIYDQYVGTYSHNSFVFTTADKTFLAGDDDNKQYVILTNFTITPTSFDVLCFKKFAILTDGDFILLPSLSGRFLSFQSAVQGSDVYKIDLDLNFIGHEIIHPRPDISPTAGELEVPLINGIPNAKQALYHRLITPKGGLRLHVEYGLPQMLGKKNSLENLILLKYNVFDQITSDSRVKNIKNIKAISNNDVVSAEVDVVLVNNDEIVVR